MSLDHILLGLLREPACGYELRERFQETAVHFWSARLSQIYPTLSRMREQGWLSAREEPSGEGPPRKVYELTESGREELVEWLRSGPVMGDGRLPYVGQIFFMDELEDPREMMSLVEDLRGEFEARLAALRAIANEWREEDARYPDEVPMDSLGPALSLEMGIDVQEARVRWCRRAEETLERRCGGGEPDRGSDSPEGE